MPSVTPSDRVTVRRAEPADASAMADLYLASRGAAFPAVPRGVHPPDDVRRWMAERLEDDGIEPYVAEQEEGLVALMLLEESWLHSLYVAPRRGGEGFGSLLLDLAKTRRPRGLGLWVFVSNEPARAFYERHGFVEVRRTEGTGPDGNEEQQPDIEMVWPDPHSLQGLRARIDDIDDRLAALLQDRATTTALIQGVKPVAGHQGRDAAREDEIVSRMAELTPSLGADRLRRIMHVVISESLEAHESAVPGPDDAR